MRVKDFEDTKGRQAGDTSVAGTDAEKVGAGKTGVGGTAPAAGTEFMMRRGNDGFARVCRAGRTTLTAAKRMRFLEVLAQTGNVRMAADAAGATTIAFYRLRRRDADFAAAWRTALAQGYDELEAQLLAEALGHGTATFDTFTAPSTDDDLPPPEIDKELAFRVLAQRDGRERKLTGDGRSQAGRKFRRVPIAQVETALVRLFEAVSRRTASKRTKTGRDGTSR